MPISYAAIDEEDNVSSINLGSNKLNKKASESVSKLTSSVSYDSLYENVDIDIDVMSSSVKETIILNDRDNVPERFSYYIKAEGLTAELYEDNSVHFVNEYKEDIFNIPAPYMFDSADFPENNYDIKVDVQEYEKGYLLTFSPDSNWIQSDERIYPVMIDPVIKTSYNDKNIDHYYNSESAPNTATASDHIFVSDKQGDRHQTYIDLNNGLNFLGTKATIISAQFYMQIYAITLNSPKEIKVYALNNEITNMTWEKSSKIDSRSTYISSFEVDTHSDTKQYSADITKLAQAWLNYANTEGTVGIKNNGFKLVAGSGPKASIKSASPPHAKGSYYVIVYAVDSDYTLHYSPYKYNDIIARVDGGNIYNFQNRMNCYAYALQVYYKGEGDYGLLPGEFGISNRPNVDEYNISDYGSLTKAYRDQYSDIRTAVQYVRDNDSRIHPPKDVYDYDDVIMTNTAFLQAINLFSNFIEELMRRDSLAMNFSLQRINCTSDFSLPSDFDEQSERIIAMITYYLSTSNNTGKIDSHFFLRNGNGTCSEHGGTCSIWTQKNGNQTVKSATNGGFICDRTIKDLAFNLPTVAAQTYLYDKNDIRYYRINQDTDLYNSYCLDGHYDDCTGTQYIDASTRNQ